MPMKKIFFRKKVIDAETFLAVMLFYFAFWDFGQEELFLSDIKKLTANAVSFFIF